MLYRVAFTKGYRSVVLKEKSSDLLTHSRPESSVCKTVLASPPTITIPTQDDAVGHKGFGQTPIQSIRNYVALGELYPFSKSLVFFMYTGDNAIDAP